MAGYLTDFAKRTLTGYLGSQATYLGLATSVAVNEQPSLANISELTDPNYGRQLITWSTSTSGVGIQNVSSLTFASPSGFSLDVPGINYGFLTDVSSGSILSVPSSAAAGSPSSGGSFAAGTYYWKVTALNSFGETTASAEVTHTLSLNQKITISWGAVSGASSYRVYRGSGAGQEDQYFAVPSGTSYEDTGSAGTAGAPPTVNTASIGNIWYIWQLTEALNVLSGKPVFIPAGGLILE